MIESNTFLKSKLARRTLLLFVLSALTPMVVLFLVTTQRVNVLYQHQQTQELSRTAKTFGLLIYERIELLRRESLIVLAELKKSTDVAATISLGAVRRPEFSEIIAFSVVDSTVNQSTPSWVSQYKAAYDNAHQEIGNKGMLLVDGSTTAIWLIFRMGDSGDGRLLAFRVSTQYLWQGLAEFDLAKEFKIYDKNNQLLFNSYVDNGLGQNSILPKSSASWLLVFTGFSSDSAWRVEVLSQEGRSFVEQAEFQTLVTLITLLAILLAFFISVNVIRRSLQPIEALRKGIDDIDANQFNSPVIIKSGDEFELLGDTFNKMSAKIGRHIQAINSLSAVDQLILNRLKIEDIVDVVVNEGAQLLQAKAIYFLVANNSSEEYLVFSSQGKNNNITLDRTLLDAIHRPLEFNHASTLSLNAELAALWAAEAVLYTSVMWHDQRAKAVLIAEFDHQPEDDLCGIANSFVDHITVALSNADWEERLFKQAHYDVLTGLPNRYLFNEQLSHGIDQAKKSGQKLGVFFVDIDGFKGVNDTYGHDAGDQLLGIMASRLTAQIDSGVVYRLGGDEFVIIYNCGSYDKSKVVEETGLVAESIRVAAVKPIILDNKRLTCSISIGIAAYPDDSEAAEELLRFSDKAMYQAKSEGRNCYRYYSEVYNRSSLEREEIIAEFHRALECDEFELFFQPKVDLSTALMDGCEALIRWNHPERGLVSPDKFIPLAETHGLISDIGRWVIHSAAKQQVEWIDSGINIGRVAINVSVSQLMSENFYSDVINILQEVNCGGEALEFEITETAYSEDLTKFTDAVVALKKIGIVFSVDDYGTGYSSLSLLLNLPVEKIKIDKSFIDLIETDRVSYTIVDSTIKLAKEMGLLVVAEGVEHQGQLSLLIDSHCDSIQGYLFSRPLPAKQFETFFEKTFFVR
ncbi:EAL domain-containing protein [Oceanicoccus sp. KOV_DT_Chl]|uniref:EAL domain-containing protein n=1 Tax=Oceanicoccus sp. KOV_DT_Chl TaxID=1904639 RepID=UPI000C7AF706|nr:EAL domain-containing protein [Oceanicoccus sp. KOV_DT_Chl]